MKKSFRGWLGRAWSPRGLRILIPVGLFLALGCGSQEALYRDVRTSRTQAYQEWLSVHEHRREAEVRIKGKLSLQDAIKLALTYNKPLQVIVEEKEVARGRILESYGEVLPKLSAIGDYTRLDEVSAFDIAGLPVSLGSVDNYSVDLEVRQPIFRGGGISAAMRAARVFSYLTDEQVRGQVQRTIYEVASVYYDMLLAQHLFAVNKDAVRSAKAHLEDVERKRAQGVASKYDVLRAQVSVSNFEAEMVKEQNEIHRARTRLLKVMGLSQESEVRLSDKLTYEPMKPILEQAVRLAYDNRPDLYQAELGVRLQQEALRIAKSRYWPRVDAVFTQEWARPDPRSSTMDEWGDAWLAGVRVEWPLFDGLRREGHIIQEKAALKQRNVELLNVQERALLEVQQAILSLRDAEQFAESQRLNLDRASEGLRLAEVGYREGIATEVEVLDARAALTRARGLYYEAIYSHTVVRLNLQRAMGILGPRAGVTTVPEESPVRPAHIDEFVKPEGSGAQDETGVGGS